MINIIKSNFIRNKRTALIWVSIFAPIMYTLFFSIYIATTHNLKGQEIHSFFGIFTILATFALSFFVPMAYESDKEAGYYFNEIRFSVSRKKIFLGKFLFILVLFILIVALASIGIFLGTKIIRIDIPSHKINFTLLGISFLTLVPLIPIYQFLTLKFGKSISILAGIFITLAAILFGSTGLVELIWPIFPFVWPIKLIYLLASSKINLNNVIIFLILAIVLTSVFLLCAMDWFSKWDVIAKTEE
ncbi:hypothetical protein [Anaerococcus nagyae]|jgi:putative lantibiotic ABC transporter, permease protein|uniref:hypothetical protein n=1 Tax=Anaerococcus nagyae TaxID=1755241 RepID=UPI003735C4ED